MILVAIGLILGPAALDRSLDLAVDPGATIIQDTRNPTTERRADAVVDSSRPGPAPGAGPRPVESEGPSAGSAEANRQLQLLLVLALLLEGSRTRRGPWGD